MADDDNDNNQAEEPFGTTPLPTSVSSSPVRIVLDVEAPAFGTAQQPQTQQIARLDSTLNKDNLNGGLVAVSQHFCVYAVKNGLIRVLHRHSALKTLLRAHREQVVTDLQFFQDGDVLATVGTSAGPPDSGKSTVLIWRVFERSPDLCAEILLEVSAPVTQGMKMDRVVWHPFNPNQFWILHASGQWKKMATLVETTRITTVSAPASTEAGTHAVCQMHTPTIVMDGAVQLMADSGDLADLCWSGRDTRLVITSHAPPNAGSSPGEVVLWDLKQLQANEDGTVSPVALQRVSTGSENANLSRVLFLPHEDVVSSSGLVDKSKNTSSSQPWTPCFLTAADNNSTFTLWSPFSEQRPPQPLQIIELAKPAETSYLIQVCSGPAPPDASPPSCFVVLADRTAGKILAFHVQAQWSGGGGEGSGDKDGDGNHTKKAVLAGCDYVVPFCTKYPTFSWSVTVQPTTDISVEDLSEQGGLIFDMKLFCCQSAQIQSLTLTSYMCLPPEHSWTDPTPAVKVERLLSVQSAHVSEIGSDEEAGEEVMQDAVEYEDYQVDDADEGEDEQVEAPEPSALPAPDGEAAASSLAANPFANWLGSLAGKKPTARAPPPPEPAAPVPVATPETPEAPPASDLPPPVSTVEAPSFLSPSDMMQDAKVAAAEPERSLTPVMGNRSPHRTEPRPFVSASMGMADEDALAAASLPMLNQHPSLDTESQSQDTTPTMLNRRPTEVLDTAGLSPDDQPIAPKRRPTVVSVTSTLTQDSVPVVPRRRTTLVNIPAGQQVLQGLDAEALKQLDDSSVDIAAEISEAVKQEMQTTVVPALKQTVQETLNKSVTNPIKSSIGQLAKSGVNVDNEKLASALVQSLDHPLRAAFADSMKTVLIPTLESVTGQVLEQVSDRIDKMSMDSDSKMEQTVETMATQISTLTNLVSQLTSEVQALKGSIQATQVAAPAAPPVAAPVQQQVDPRAEILALLQQKNFEAAFTKAVSAGSPVMTVFCCANADLNEVLGGTSPKLSQPILLCLVQQLGTALTTDMSSDLKIELAWLQEIALSLNPADPNIHRHVTAVLSQLVANINTRMQRGEPALQRPLQRLLQVIRGMQMS